MTGGNTLERGYNSARFRTAPAYQTAGQHSSPPAKSKLLANLSRTPVPQDGFGAKIHPHSETDAASKSSTKKTAVLSKRAANTVPCSVPTPRGSHSYKIPPARVFLMIQRPP